MVVVPQTKLFGTDGVRGPVGDFLSAELAFALGRAAVSVSGAKRPQVLVVRDTRVSGEMLESALCAGIAAGGGDALLGGVLPSAAASLLVRRLGLDLSVVISASHNPYQDNGIKFFDGRGYKLSDESEAAIEERLSASGPSASGRVRPLVGALDDYLRELGSRFTTPLDGVRVLLDCGNGAAYRAAPLIFERLGANVEAVACEPSGTNINAGCGSTHIEYLSGLIKDRDCEIGFALDGDADRVLAVDAEGGVVDGDEIIAQAALHLKSAGELAGDGVAVTVMTNFGFHRAMQAAGIEVATVRVGDRHVVEELASRGWVLGGEQSGHVIDMRLTPSADGTATALLLLEALAGRDLTGTRLLEKLPQVLVNVAVADRDGLERASAIWEAVESESAALDGRGRVLVRPSGTEQLIRVMVEAPDESECEAIGARLAALVARELGGAPTAP
jgi:phosphoglucosamine mutase